MPPNDLTATYVALLFENLREESGRHEYRMNLATVDDRADDKRPRSGKSGNKHVHNGRRDEWLISQQEDDRLAVGPRRCQTGSERGAHTLREVRVLDNAHGEFAQGTGNALSMQTLRRR